MFKLSVVWTVLSVLQIVPAGAYRSAVRDQTFRETPQASESKAETESEALPPPTVEEWMENLDLNNAQARADAAAELGKLGKKAAAAVPRLTELLSQPGVGVAAVKALGEIGGAAKDSVASILAKMPNCQSMDCPYMAAATTSLGKIGKADPEAVLPAMEKALTSDSWPVRWLAVTVCGDLGENSLGLVPKIRMISLADGDGDVKKAAKKSLEEIAKAAKSALPKPDLPEVLQYLDKNQADVKLYALERLGEMGGAAKDSVAASIVSKMPGCQSMDCPYMVAAATSLGKIGKADPEAVLPAVEKALTADKWNIRWLAATVCGDLGEKSLDLVPKIRMVSLADSDGDVKKAAKRSLEEIAKAAKGALPKPDLPEVLQYLDKNQADVKLYALERLGEMGGAAKDSVASIVAKMPGCQSMDCPYMAAAATSLGKIGKADPEAVLPAMEKALTADKWNIRWLAATVCGDLGEKSLDLVPKIRMVSLADSDGDVKKAAKRSLEEIAKATKSALPKPDLPEVLQYLDKNQADVKLYALERLGEMGGAAKDSVASIVAKMPGCQSMDCPYMVAAATSLGKIGTADPEAVLPAMEKALTADKWNIRWLAATVCGDLGEKSLDMVPKIRMVSLADSDGDVKKAAKKSLEEIAKAAKSALPKPDLPEVLQYLDKNQADVKLYALERLGEMGGAAKDSVASIVAKMPGCQSMDCPYMVAAATSLGKIGKADPEAVLPAMEKALTADKWNIRWLAVAVCRTLGKSSLDLLPLIRKASLCDSDADVKKTAKQTLEEIVKVVESLSKPSLAELLQYLSRDENDAKFYALERLGEMGGAAKDSVASIVAKMPGCQSMDCPYMVAAATSLGKIGKADPEAVLPAVEKALTADKWNIRWLAATVCGDLGEKSLDLVPKIRMVSLADSDGDVKKAAKRSLEEIAKATKSALPKPDLPEVLT